MIIVLSNGGRNTSAMASQTNILPIDEIKFIYYKYNSRNNVLDPAKSPLNLVSCNN